MQCTLSRLATHVCDIDTDTEFKFVSTVREARCVLISLSAKTETLAASRILVSSSQSAKHRTDRSWCLRYDVVSPKVLFSMSLVTSC